VGAAVTNGLGAALGTGIESNPTSADFGKLKIGGTTRFDTMGGYQQPLVLLARGLMGETKSSTTGKSRTLGEGYKADTVGSMAGNFAMNKLHPMARLIVEMLNATGKQPLPLGDKIMQAYIPMITQDAIELGMSDPRLTALLPLISAGGGTQTYDKGFKQNLFFGEDGLTGYDEPLNMKSISPRQWFK
jgi:hypothetical protein